MDNYTAFALGLVCEGQAFKADIKNDIQSRASQFMENWFQRREMNDTNLSDPSQTETILASLNRLDRELDQYRSNNLIFLKIEYLQSPFRLLRTIMLHKRNQPSIRHKDRLPEKTLPNIKNLQANNGIDNHHLPSNNNHSIFPEIDSHYFLQADLLIVEVDQLLCMLGVGLTDYFLCAVLGVALSH